LNKEITRQTSEISLDPDFTGLHQFCQKRKGFAVFGMKLNQVQSSRLHHVFAALLVAFSTASAGCRLTESASQADDTTLAATPSQQDDAWTRFKTQVDEVIRKMKSFTKQDAEPAFALGDGASESQAQTNPSQQDHAQLNQALLDSANAYYGLSRDILVILRDMKTNVQEKDVEKIRGLINLSMPLLQNLATMGIQVLTQAKVLSPGMETAIAMAYLRNLPGIVNTTFNLTMALYNRLGPNEINMIIGMIDALMGMINSHADLLNLGKPAIDLGQTAANIAMPSGGADCKQYNRDGLTCQQLGLFSGQTSCKWGSVWRCEGVCVRWQSPGFCN
jgi:hypothetical protein